MNGGLLAVCALSFAAATAEVKAGINAASKSGLLAGVTVLSSSAKSVSSSFAERVKSDSLLGFEEFDPNYTIGKTAGAN